MKRRDNLEEFMGCEKDLTFNEYQEQAKTTMQYRNIGSNLFYPALGLNGEAGEVAEHVKKMDRDDNGFLTEERKNSLMKEAGDVCWYLAALCHELNVSFGEVAQMNLDKLADRKKRGVLKGSGDNR